MISETATEIVSASAPPAASMRTGKATRAIGANETATTIFEAKRRMAASCWYLQPQSSHSNSESGTVIGSPASIHLPTTVGSPTSIHEASTFRSTNWYVT